MESAVVEESAVVTEEKKYVVRVTYRNEQKFVEFLESELDETKFAEKGELFYCC